MKALKLGKLYYEISRHNPPVLSIQPGETVSVETEDAFSGQVRKETDRRDRQKLPYGNPQSGPIYVEGAEKGDTLAVRIEKIEARIGQAATHTGGHGGLGRKSLVWLGRLAAVSQPRHIAPAILAVRV